MLILTQILLILPVYAGTLSTYTPESQKPPPPPFGRTVFFSFSVKKSGPSFVSGRNPLTLSSARMCHVERLYEMVEVGVDTLGVNHERGH